MDLFSAPGMARWRDRLNTSARFADAARNWAGRLLLIESEDKDQPASRRLAWVQIDGGRCLEARVGEPMDEEAAEYVLEASAGTWTDLIDARITPTMAALRGRLHLRKGDVLKLVPHAGAAAELLAAAADGAL